MLGFATQPPPRGRLALVGAGLPRGEAYRLVQRNAMRAWDEERDFRTLVQADQQIAAKLDADAIDGAFDLAATVQPVEVVFETVSDGVALPFFRPSAR